MTTNKAKTQGALLKKFERVSTIFIVEGKQLTIPEPEGLKVEMAFGYGSRIGRKGLFDKADGDRYDIKLLERYFEVYDLGDYWALHGSVRWFGVQLSNGGVVS